MLVSVLSFSPARALTAQEILDKMSKDESTGYLYGTMESAAFIAHLQGNKARAECIAEWYHQKGGVQQIMDSLTRFKDHQAQPIIHMMIKRACGQ